MRRTDLYRIVLSAFVFLLVNSVSFSQNGTITGKVKYSKEVLQAVNVTLGNKTVPTNHNGEFSFSLASGNYTLTLTHAGYKAIKHVITVIADSTQYYDFEMEANEPLGNLVVLGSRSPVQRSNLNTPVPVDVFSSTQLAQTGQPSLLQMLNFVAPSLRASLQFATEPITLRGLDPNHTLILLNNTRYHNIAHINRGTPNGVLGRGSAGNDLNTIPFSAIEKVEILRDGASAQYGSDAIAGVINILLKESTGKTSVNLHLGQHYKGDGENIALGVYHGISLNKKGFLNFSGDLRYRFPTFRGGEYSGTVYRNYPMNATSADSIRIKSYDDSTIKARGFDRMNMSNSGTTKLSSFGFLMNGAYRIKNKMELFWTGSLNYQTLIFVNGYVTPRNTNSVNTELFPDGYKSNVRTNTWNVSAIAGARGEIGNKIYWEYNSAFGMNTPSYYSENTNNASQQYILGKTAPTNFYTGTLNYKQLTNTIHFTKTFYNPGEKLKTNLGWGAEVRFENFKMKAGEEASWKNYDSSLKKQGGLQLSQVVYPDDALNNKRSIICAYIDFETEPDNRFLLNLSSRFEYYSDFGSNLAGKLAARYKLFDKLSLRGSISNGFRAPSMQQRYYSSIGYGTASNGNGGLTGTRHGIFNNEHKVTRLFGIPSLEAEKSLNLSGGLTSTISKHIYLTIDAYWIQIKNRIVLSGAFERAINPEVNSLLSDSSLANLYIDQVAFFANAINTRTHGIDVVLHGKWNFHKAQLIAIMAANFTQTSLYGDIETVANLSATGNKNSLFNQDLRTGLEKGQPRSKIILSLNYKLAKFGFMLRNTRFAKTGLYNTNMPETFSPKIVTDVSISYTPKSWLTITTGCNNIFDVYPDRLKNYINTGEGRMLYPVNGAPFGFMGGYYFVSMSLNF